MSPNTKTTRALFALSQNKCAFPKCPILAYDQETGSVLVQICHIEGHKPDSARYRKDQTDAERHALQNLILMCGVHHKIIDDDEESYTVERLKKIKASHEIPTEALNEKDIDDAAKKALAGIFLVNTGHIEPIAERRSTVLSDPPEFAQSYGDGVYKIRAAEEYAN